MDTPLVAPYTGAWIEIGLNEETIQTAPVAPYTGAWIEIRPSFTAPAIARRSLPTRERGLKFSRIDKDVSDDDVAPYTGAWIEITKLEPHSCARFVAPYTGAWIEIFQASPACYP